MKVVVQRCMKASVRVENNTVGSIGKGLMLLVGFTYGDSEEEIDYITGEGWDKLMKDDSLTADISPSEYIMRFIRAKEPYTGDSQIDPLDDLPF